jgi:hypothetical protein
MVPFEMLYGRRIKTEYDMGFNLLIGKVDSSLILAQTD